MVFLFILRLLVFRLCGLYLNKNSHKIHVEQTKESRIIAFLVSPDYLEVFKALLLGAWITNNFLREVLNVLSDPNLLQPYRQTLYKQSFIPTYVNIERYEWSSRFWAHTQTDILEIS